LHDELMAVIKESGCSTLTEFVAQMNQFEEDMFIMYAELQEKSDEMDRVERENKHLEQRLETEVCHVCTLNSCSNVG
jgi:ubiquinone biosynthesis protein UbiJ